MLGTLAGKQEKRLPAIPPSANIPNRGPPVGSVRRERTKGILEFGARSRDDGRPERMMNASGVEGARHVSDPNFGVEGEVGRQPFASLPRASSLFPEMATRAVERSRPRSPADGASSRITWAFVPLNPKELTPASGVFRPGPRAGFRHHLDRPSRPIHIGIGRPEVELRRNGPVSRERTVLMSPAMPAAPSRCPMFVLTEPTRRGFGPRALPAEGGSQGPQLDGVAEGSAGSVRLHIVDRARGTPASARAARITASCDNPFGAVNPLLRPSW